MPKRALVVDDSTQMRHAVISALARLKDVSCVEAQDGAEAIRKLATQGPFDLVLTDINMPLLDGLKLIAHIRKDPLNRALPIVVITTEAAEADRARALHLGANAYLIKPVKAAEVLAAAQALLDGQRQGGTT